MFMNNHKVEIRKTKYRTNRGMSMLEVIIAVSIFSVAAAVLLQGFVTSGRVNKKSGLYLEATTIAQNVMEEIKAKDFEEVALAFNYPIDNETGETRLQFLNSHKQEVGGALRVYEALPARNSSGNTEYKEVILYNEKFGNDTSKVTASVISEDQGKTYEFNPRETGANASKYYFILTNVENDNETFDVLVELDGSVSSGYKSPANTTNANANKKNDYLVPNILKMDAKSDAMLVLRESDIEHQLDTLIKNVQNRYGLNAPINVKDVRPKTKMTLNLKVDKDKSGTTSVESILTLDAYDYYMTYIKDTLGPDTHQHEHEDWILPNSETFYSSGPDSELKGLFVFYPPNYESTSSSQPLDNIVLDNTKNQELQFYVIKQGKKGSITSRQESSYKVALEVKDSPANYEKAKPNWYTNQTMFRAITKLRTNLNINIATNDRARIKQLFLTYTGFDNQFTKSVKGTIAEKILDMNDLDVREETDRIYTLNVGVYKEGAAGNGFPDSELVASLEGAKEK